MELKFKSGNLEREEATKETSENDQRKESDLLLATSLIFTIPLHRRTEDLDLKWGELL